MSRFACGYCGAQLVVQRSGGTVSLRLVEETLQSIRTGTDRTAAELAIRRLCEEVAPLRRQASQLKHEAEYYISCVSAENDAIAAAERASSEVKALKEQIQIHQSKEAAGKLGCLATIVGGPILLIFVYQAGWLAVLAVVIGSIVMGVKSFANILSDASVNFEERARYAEYEETRAKDKEVAARALSQEWADKRSAAISQLAILEPQIRALEQRIAENKRIADG